MKTLEEIIAQGIQMVYLKAYGYEELSLITSHYEPFSHCREIGFTVTRKNLISCSYWVEEVNLSDNFELRDGKWVSVMNYELYSKESNHYPKYSDIKGLFLL